MATARTKRRRRRKPGDVAALRRVLWEAVRDVEAIVHDGDGATVDQRVKAAHALATLAGAYLRATEAAELVQRLDELEAIVNGREA